MLRLIVSREIEQDHIQVPIVVRVVICNADLVLQLLIHLEDGKGDAILVII